MAKRKRLTPAQTDHFSGPVTAAPTARAPIAQVAGDAAAAAAFHDVAGELARARDEGRLVQSLPLEAIHAEHLMRDRMALDPEALSALRDSIRARGQQTPVEVVDLGEGRYGLVSGWRRLRALRDLHRDTGEARFASVLALLRRPEDDAQAYVAMVEENEIRADLSFFERARIVRRATQGGVFADDQSALNALFASATHARRSKIKSFLRVVDSLGDVLRHPARLSEHLGLKLSKALATDPGLPARVSRALAGIDPQDADAEIAALQTLLAPKSVSKGPAEPKPAPKTPAEQAIAGRDPDRVQPTIPGIGLKAKRGEVVLSGNRVTGDFVNKLEAWLASLEK